ncbi:hypothetical protein ACFE04_030998 [Oxalis oulophora]
MATIQRFKFMIFATQCSVAQSPTRSPATSPLVQLRRQKTTLRMLLTRKSSDILPPRSSSQEYSKTTTNQQSIAMSSTKKSKLKDLFVSASSPEFGEEAERKSDCKVSDVAASIKVNGLGGIGVRESAGSMRSGWTGFRHRVLLRKAWRPLLVTIPEEF